jgi:chemotaxis protein CheD
MKPATHQKKALMKLPLNQPAPIGFTGLTGRMKVIDVGQLGVCNDPETVIVTYALGSCIGVALWDPVVRVGGLAHVQLPDSALDPAKSMVRPGVFADSAVAELLRRLATLGAVASRCHVHVAGGAQLMGDAWLYDIGRKNRLAVLAALRSYGLAPVTDDTGGREPRTVYLEVGAGLFHVRRGAGAIERPKAA